MHVDPETFEQARALRERVDQLRREADAAQAELHAAIVDLAATGATLREIADAFNLSHQRVHQILDQKGQTMLTKLTRRRGRRPGATAALSRLSPTARVAVEIAQEEADALQHDFIGTEHLLLGIVRADTRIAAALARQGLSVDTVRDELVARVGRGRQRPQTPTKRLQPRLKLALERAVGDVERAGRADIESIDILRGIAAVEESVGAQILAAHAVDVGRLRRA